MINNFRIVDTLPLLPAFKNVRVCLPNTQVILQNTKFPNKSYVEKKERLQKLMHEEKSTYLLKSTICYGVFLVCYNSTKLNV